MWRFCCVRREDDRTTVWFREHVRDPLSRDVADGRVPRSRLAEATVIFRWFNRIETGERVLDLLLGGWDTGEARRRLAGAPKVVTGAYIVRTPFGMSKLDGVLECFEAIRGRVAGLCQRWGPSLQAAWADLAALPYQGGFTAYEVVSDLRWTPLLDRAGDIMTWANAGPGAARGLGWILYGGPSFYSHTSQVDQFLMANNMLELLGMSQDPSLWPTEWPRWEMREVEHWCCEFDKYQRASRGGRLKRRFV